MADELWITVPNWDRFQHYKDRDPPWIKLYTELNSRDEWLDLSDAEKGLLVTIWIEYARSKCRLRSARVPLKVGQRSRRRQYERLVQAGWIEVSASTRAHARREERREETPKPPLGLRLLCPECGLELKSARRLNEHREVVHEVAVP